ncbi:MAPEG family protein (plasmid) [Rhizobium sp. RCAM05350]|nr:MAPEG family protein [Rhizobium sp. RCAM05350]
MNFPISSLYAILLAVIFLLLLINVSKTRSALSLSIGDAGNVDLHERMRRHGNFIEWVPMILILMMLAEGQGAGPLWLHAAGALTVGGRVLHPFGLRANAPAHPLRIIGNSACILATVILTITLALSAFAL